MTDTGAGIDRLTAWLVRLPLRRAFVSATTHIQERRVIIVKLAAGEHEGWGEAAPVPGHGSDDVDLLWARLVTRGDAIGLALLDSATGMLAAAIEEAAADLNARVIGQPLWRILGSGARVVASAAVGVADDGNPDRRQIQAAADDGYRRAKLKVTPRTRADVVAGLVAEYPMIEFGADGNGTLASDGPTLIHALDEIGLAYIEQPGPEDALELHSRLRRTMQTPIALDETAVSLHRIRQIVASSAADIVNLKVGRFGTTTTRRLAGDLVAAGLQSRLGGLVETGIGRSHSIALGGHEFFAVAGDIAASGRYFDEDLVHPPWAVVDGEIVASELPGIGVEVDEAAVAAHSEDTVAIV